MNAHAPILTNDPWSWIWSLGYRAIVPIEPRKKSPGVLTSVGWLPPNGWQTAYPSESDVDRYRDTGAGVGVRCEKGLLAIDCDTLIDKVSTEIENEITARLGTLPQRIGRAPKKLFFLRTEPTYAHRNIQFDGGAIEVRTRGQFVAAGIHPDTGAAYQWVRPLPPIDDLPFVAPDALDALFEALRALLPNGRFTGGAGDLAGAPSPESLLGSVARVRAALKHIPNDYAGRDDYRNVVMAVKGSLWNDLATAWEISWGWCVSWEGPNGETNDIDVVRKDFDSFKPAILGIGYLEDLARQRSGGVSISERFHEVVESVEHESLFPEEPKESPPPSLLGSVYTTPATPIPPRQFLYGHHYLRQYVSATIAPTKVGKTSLGVVEALAMASGKPLLGVKPTGLWRVRLWNGEDPREELDRRIAAAMQEYGLTMEDIGDRLLRDSGRDMPICIAEQSKSGTKIWRPVVAALGAAIEAQRLDVLNIDPFVKSHGVSENDNMAIDQVAREWNGVAGRCAIAVELVHHSRKTNGAEASIEDARGASALVSAARSARVLARMTKKEGERAGKSKDYKRFFRFADAVSNMAISAGDDETWMELKSVDLHNAVFAEDGGLLWPSDLVGVVKISEVRGALDDDEPTEAHLEAERAALAELASGDWKQDSQSRDAWAGVAVARAYGLALDDPDDKARVKMLLKTWLKNGKITTDTRRDSTTRQLRSFVKVPLQVVTKPAFDLFG